MMNRFLIAAASILYQFITICLGDDVSLFASPLTSSFAAMLPLCTSSIQHYPAVRSPSTLYIRCTDPGHREIYIWRCPSPLVWSQEVGGCVEKDQSELRALPELVGVLDEDALSRGELAAGSSLAQSTSPPPDHAGFESIVGLGQRTDNYYFQKSTEPQSIELISTPMNSARLPTGVDLSSGSLSATVDYPGSAIYNQERQPADVPPYYNGAHLFAPHRAVPVDPLSVNPCLPFPIADYNDYYSTNSADTSLPRQHYYRPHPEHPTKYVECYPDERLIVVRRCPGKSTTVWSQQHQACVDDGLFHPDLSRPIETMSVTGALPGPFEEVHTLSVENPCIRMILGGRDQWPTWLTRRILYHPYPGDKTRFIQCDGGPAGRAFVRQCPYGLRWDQRVMTCDWTTDVRP